MVRLAAVLVCLAGSSRAAPPPYINNENAALAIGQQDLVSGGVNGTQGVAASGLSKPSGIWSDGIHLIVADANNNRVKIYNAIPASSGVDADVVVGQPDFSSSLANQGGVAAANTLSGPTGVYYDAVNDRLYIADTGNNRVLIFNTLPASNNTAADVVVGQPDFVSASANQGLALPTAQTLSRPVGVYSNGGDLYISDQANNRVLTYAGVPGVNDPFASYVVGQASFNVKLANMGGAVRPFTLFGPSGIWSDGAAFYVADSSNSRVLIYSVLPTTNAVSANFVVGQVSLSSGASNQGAANPTSRTLSFPQAVSVDAGGRLILGDTNNNRALIYAAVPGANNAQASAVVGQATFTVRLANQGFASPSATSLAAPASVVSDNALFYIADQSNNRGLIYNPLPAGAGAAASVAVGQADLITGTPNQAATVPTAAGLFRPASVKFDAANLYIADRNNSRVVIFNAFPRVSGAGANIAVGQPNLGSGPSNQGTGVAANTLSFPNDTYSDGAKLYVADQANNRVLVYNAIPTANNANATFVLGQSSFTQNGFNMGGTVRAFTLLFPAGVHADGTHLLAADRLNNRVLIYNLPIATNTVSAARVLGQTLFTTNGVNQGGLGAGSLNQPNAVFSTGTMVFVADTLNNRVLIWNAFPGVNGQAADVVVGQAGFGANASNQGLAAPTSKTLSRPTGVWSDGASLYVSDAGNSRVLVYYPIPTANNAAAGLVIGQAAMTTGSANQGAGVGANTLSGPAFVSVDSATGRMFAVDNNANRVVLYYPASVSSVTAAGGTASLNSTIGPVQVTATVPSFAFGGATSIALEAQTAFPAARSAAAVLTATGVGFRADINPTTQPNQEVLLNVVYRPADVASFDPSRLLVARYDTVAGTWVPLVSVSAPANNTIFARTDHFSLFQLMQSETGTNTPSTVVAFPNPLQPNLGQTKMTFSSAPANARIRIYTLTGALIKDFSADGAGLASWDATNSSGAKVSSGVYFVFIQGGGRKHTLKVAIER